MRRSCPPHLSGFALVATLAIVTLMAIILIAFLGSLVNERASSNAIANAARAELAAEAGVDFAIATLKSHIEAHPDSATVWEELSNGPGEPATGATVLYFRTSDPNAPSVPATSIQLLPLVSGAIAKTSHSNPLPRANPLRSFSDADNSVDLNRARFQGDVTGWIGSPPGGRQAVRVPWVEMTSPDNPEKVIARYAFMVEDESFKLNLNTMGIAPRGEGTGETPDQIPIQGFLQAVSPSDNSSDDDATNIAALRARFPRKRFFDLLVINRLGTTPSGIRLGEAGKFFGTIHSASLNLSRSGAKRVNINTLFQSSTEPGEVRAQLDAFIAPIRHEIPHFGQRFYRTDASNLNDHQVGHEDIYLQKIAANIRDYIVSDSQPTLVNDDGTIALGAKPLQAIEPNAIPVRNQHHGGTNPVIAVGKKNVPFLQEFACRITLNKFSPNKGGASITQAEYQFDLDYYLEFWNMTPKPISVAAGDLGLNPFIRIYNLPEFDTGGGTPIPAGGFLEIPLPTSTVFPAGKVTVLTTDSDPASTLVRDASRIVILPDTPARHYEGWTQLKVSTNFRINLIPRNTQRTDYSTKMLLGNDNGILESVCSLPLVRGTNTGLLALQIHNDNEGTDDDLIDGANREQYLIRGGSLHGNLYYNTPQITGDPRTNNEQLYLCIYDPATDTREQTRYYNSGLDNPNSSGTHVPENSSIGTPNSNFVDVTQWPDPYLPSSDHVDTPMFIANAPMKSIGELGHVFDPARALGPSGNILYSRGGGRTFTIGQPDPLWDQDSVSKSREWAAWRLTDLFSTTDATRLEGRINLNGTLRDGGVALRAALHGFQFSMGDDADPRLAGKALEPEVLENLVAKLSARLNETSTRGPLAERGELSEILNFSPGGRDIERNHLYDRGREELFRRLIELTTTRGSIFSVYAIGQSIAHTPSGKKNVTATSHLKITFELIPVWDNPLPEKIDPDNPADRLRPPSSFKVKILQASP